MGDSTGLAEAKPQKSASSSAPPPTTTDIDKSLLPGQPRSLSGIALRAFSLGIALALGLCGTVVSLLLAPSSPLWRLPFQLAVLAAFHFLEFWTQARYNTRVVGTLHFLLTGNGRGYALAHVLSALECLLTSTLFGSSSSSSVMMVVVGVAVLVMGQTVRSVAMAQAGVSFNHEVQQTKKESHVLVTTGLYGVFRHPSYFGFYWWVVGLQLVMGNVVCLVLYVVVLYKYYSSRIPFEEAHLVDFFGQDYIDYRKRVGTKIPFVP